MATGKAFDGKPYAGNPHVRFDEGEVAPAATPRRGSLLYTYSMRHIQRGLALLCLEFLSRVCACSRLRAREATMGAGFVCRGLCYNVWR